MENKEAIEYLLYMKHDVQAGSPVDVAIDTAIEALKETAKKPKSNADRIRQMTDEELAKKLRCDSCLYQDMKSECESSECVHGILAWLRKEVSEDADD